MFTIIGLIVTVAAVLVLLVGVLHVGAGGMESTKATNAAGELAQIELGLQSLYSAQATFASATDTVAIDAGIVPTNMQSGNSIINEWGGAVDIAVAGTDSEFTITESGIPQDACSTLATKVTNPISVSVNGTALGAPIDAGLVAADCNGASNTLQFTFGH